MFEFYHWPHEHRLKRVILPAATVILFLFLQAATAGSQERKPEFETSLLSVFRSVSRGEAKKALLFYETRAIRFEELAKSGESPKRNWEAAARAYREASNSAHYLGNLEKAIVYGERAFAVAEKLGNRRLKLMSLSTLGLAFRSARNFTKAEEFVELALKIAKEWPQNSLDWMWWHGVFYLHRGRDLTRRREYEKAIEDFDQTIRLKNEFLRTIPGVGREVEQRKEHARTNILLAYAGRAGAYLSWGKSDQALDTYQTALESAKEWGVEFPQSSFYLGIGESLHALRNYSAALENFQKAFDLARRQQRPAVISNAARRIGDVLRETGKRTEAVVFYRQAIQEIESVRSLLASNQNRQSYFGGWLGAYWGLTETLWEAGAQEQAFHYGERVRSRAFLDMLGTKVHLTKMRNADALGLAALSHPEDSEEAYRAFIDRVRQADPEQASLMTVQPLTLNQVQALLEPDQVLLDYLVSPRKLYLWVVDKQQARAFTVPLSQKELVGKVQGLRTAISELRPLKEYQAIARDLHQQLLMPADSFIQGKELIIVPHDVLHYLPFQALYSPRGKYLIEEHSLSYLSSASLLQFTTAKRKPRREKVLAVGNPRSSNPEVELQAAESETRSVARLYRGSRTLLREKATEEKIKELSAGYDVLHFAAHAELKEDDPLSSAILLANEGKEDGRLEVREIFQMNINADLVVLSGCETGLGKLSEGDEFVGLTRAFIYAGTPSVVASLWKVEDSSTAALMASFYRNLRTMTKVEALRQAQLELIRGEVRSDLLAQRGVGGVGKLGETPKPQSLSQGSVPVSVAHPYFWAPFILVGDGK